MSCHVLLAEEDAETIDRMERRFREHGHTSRRVRSVAEALATIESERPDAVFLAAELPDLREAVERLTDLGDPPPLVLIRSATGPPLAVEAVSAPFPSIDVLTRPLTPRAVDACLERALQRRALANERDRLRRGRDELALAVLAGDGGVSVRLKEQVRRVAGTPGTTVLLTGNRGEGRAWVAAAIHASSNRRRAPFVSGSCALPPDPHSGLDLATSIFGRGHRERGRARHRGWIEEARGGTLYLAEIDAAPFDVQEALLRFLDEGAFTPAAGARGLAGDVRLIASAERELERMVEEGSFRGDLLYRLNVLSIRVPSLAERRADVGVLATGLLRAIAAELQLAPKRLSPAAIEALAGAGGAANMRLLRNALERGLLAGPGGIVLPCHLGLDPRTAKSIPGERGTLVPIAGARTLKEAEETCIRRVLGQEKGNRSRTARVLGINRSTLYNKLREYGID